MTPVYQTLGHPNGGNCMQAAIASVLELPLDAVPDFVDIEREEWFPKMVGWAQEHGLGVITVLLDKRVKWPLLHGVYMVVVGNPPGTKKFHSVVCKGVMAGDNTADLLWAHDPNPDKLWLKSIKYGFSFVGEYKA